MPNRKNDIRRLNTAGNGNRTKQAEASIGRMVPPLTEEEHKKISIAVEPCPGTAGRFLGFKGPIQNWWVRNCTTDFYIKRKIIPA